MGFNYYWGFVKDRKEMIEVVCIVMDVGIMMFDIVEVYGFYINEEFVGEVLVGKRNYV